MKSLYTEPYVCDLRVYVLQSFQRVEMSLNSGEQVQNDLEWKEVKVLAIPQPRCMAPCYSPSSAHLQGLPIVGSLADAHLLPGTGP